MYLFSIGTRVQHVTLHKCKFGGKFEDVTKARRRFFIFKIFFIFLFSVFGGSGGRSPPPKIIRFEIWKYGPDTPLVFHENCREGGYLE